MNKEETYRKILETLDVFIGDTRGKYHLDDIGKMATISAVIKRAFPHILYVGFYRVVEPNLLQIGPYQGEDFLACGSIPFDRGVCGACATRGITIIVPDVSKFPGYIACDEKTRSEIVVPVVRDGEVVAVLDMDSPELDEFDELDKISLEELVLRFLGTGVQS